MEEKELGKSNGEFKLVFHVTVPWQIFLLHASFRIFIETGQFLDWRQINMKSIAFPPRQTIGVYPLIC